MRGPNASAESCHQGYWGYYQWRMRQPGGEETFGKPIGRGRLPRGTERFPGEIRRERLNDILAKCGFDRVSERTFNNYRKNWAQGHHPNDYVPINRTDYNVPEGPSDVPGEFVDPGRAS